MSGFRTHTGTIAVLPIDDVDTDRIIPARFLSRVERSGYGDLLFKDVRGPEFPLDQPDAAGASILVTGANFGCGSSREHAVWAIQQAGFQAVIGKVTPAARGFSDIFRQNATNCGLLLIDLPETDHSALRQGETATIDLPAQTIQAGTNVIPFELPETLKTAMLEGLDLIGTTLRLTESIAEYEKRNQLFVPPAAR